jgi:hypothetical protein
MDYLWLFFGYFLWVKIKYGWIRRIFDGLGSLYINQVDIHVKKKIPRVILRPDVNRQIDRWIAEFLPSLSLSLSSVLNKIYNI